MRTKQMLPDGFVKKAFGKSFWTVYSLRNPEGNREVC